jgi:hypothetical protein
MLRRGCGKEVNRNDINIVWNVISFFYFFFFFFFFNLVQLERNECSKLRGFREDEFRSTTLFS